MLQAAAVADRAGAQKLTGVQGFRAGHVGNHVFETPAHITGITAPPLLAIDPGNHIQVIGITQFIGCHQAGPHNVGRIKILALGRAEHAGHFQGLGVAGTHVVEDGVADDMRPGGLTADVLAALTDVATELEFEIHRPAVARPLKFIVDANHRETVALVVDGLLVESLDDPIVSTSVHRFQRGFRVFGT